MSQDVFVPMTADGALLRSRRSVWMVMIGRIAPGASVEQS